MSKRSRSRISVMLSPDEILWLRKHGEISEVIQRLISEKMNDEAQARINCKHVNTQTETYKLDDKTIVAQVCQVCGVIVSHEER